MNFGFSYWKKGFFKEKSLIFRHKSIDRIWKNDDFMNAILVVTFAKDLTKKNFLSQLCVNWKRQNPIT